jgi:hypothetical protein
MIAAKIDARKAQAADKRDLRVSNRKNVVLPMFRVAR